MTTGLINKRIASFILLILIWTVNSEAQVLQASAQKILHFKNVSYTEVLKTKWHFQEDFDSDTLQAQIAVVPAEPQVGSYYKIASKNEISLFDGDKRISLYLPDTTYRISKEAVGGQYTRQLLYWAKQMEKYLKTPAKIKQVQDTLINKKAYSNILFIERDTIEKSKPVYARYQFIIDKITNLPYLVAYEFYAFSDDGGYIGLREEHIYSDYKFNQKNFPDLSDANAPANFNPPVPSKPLAPLAAGTKAPSLILKDLSGKTFDMEQLKGKVVLLNFSSIGCIHCVNAAPMLNGLYKKYKDQGFGIVSVYNQGVTKTEAITKFDKRFDIAFPSYATPKNAEELYAFRGYPSFFILDKQGAIQQYYSGFYPDLEEQLAEKIKALLAN